MARLILGVTGSVAAIRTPALLNALLELGHEIRVVATEPALYFFDPADLAEITRSAGHEANRFLFRDQDEWPRSRYARDDEVLHIAFRKWADLLIVAPLDANTLAKFALGLSDNFLTCLFRAWDFNKPVILAPAMNTLMWESPVTLRHLKQLAADRGSASSPSNWTLNEAAAAFASHVPRITLVPPQAKRLACGDTGQGAMAEVTAIAEVVRSRLAMPDLDLELRLTTGTNAEPGRCAVVICPRDTLIDASWVVFGFSVEPAGYFGGLPPRFRAEPCGSAVSCEAVGSFDLAAFFPALVPLAASAVSQFLMNVFAGIRLMASPMTSSARSSTLLNRTHDLPISSFFPVLAQASLNQFAFATSLYTHMR